MATTINIINPCPHTNYPLDVLESSHIVIVKLRYEAIYRCAYRLFTDLEIPVLYFPITSRTTMSRPFNLICRECKADIERNFVSGAYGPLPDDRVQETINHTVALLQQKVFHLAQELRYEMTTTTTTPTTLEGSVLISRCYDYFFYGIAGQLEQQDQDGPRPSPATEWAVEELERVKGDDGDVAADEDCAVCLEGLMSQQKEELMLIRMPCQHVFHEGCIVEWLRKSHVCPLCRYELPVEDDYPSH